MQSSADSYVGWKEWQEKSFGSFDFPQASYFRAETGIESIPGLRVLEIGFGNGSFLGWAKSIGVEAYGVEVSSPLVERARALLGEGRVFLGLDDSRLMELAGTVSHVVAIDVIEHIELCALPTAFSRIHDLLLPGGRCILRFPNGDSPFGRINQHGDPTHVTTLGAEMLRYFATESGLQVQTIRAPALPIAGVSYARALKRCLILAGRFVVERTLSLLYFGGRRIPLDPNYTAILIKP
jgi:SAM-dependent methyltransferase